MERPILDFNGKQLSPCICTRVIYVFTHRISNSEKTCTLRYWNRVVNLIGFLMEQPPNEIIRVKNEFPF